MDDSEDDSRDKRRWFRMEIKYPESGPISDFRYENVAHGDPPSIPNSIELLGSAPALRKAIGKCIYCGASEFEPGSGRALSEEHIIPEGLGARLILTEASCKACAEQTKRIEGSVLRELFWAPRVKLGIRRKKRKRNESSFPLTVIFGENEHKFMLPISGYPTALLMPVLNAPRIITREGIGLQGFWMFEFNSFHRTAQIGLRHFATPRLDIVRFCQFIAKIAHGYAVSVFGIDGFKALLPPFILECYSDGMKDCPDKYHLVGGSPSDYAPSETLHVLGWGGMQSEVDGTIYLAAEAIDAYADAHGN